MRRFGLVTTNSITQVFQRRVLERHLSGKDPVGLTMAIADHPWTKATVGAAAVRIAMTVGQTKVRQGLLRRVKSENQLDTDTPVVEFEDNIGLINSNLTVGIDVNAAKPLLANDALCSTGVKLHGAGFVVTPAEASHLGLGNRPDLEMHIRQYRNGRDIIEQPRGVMVIDLLGLDAEQVRLRYPEVYRAGSANLNRSISGVSA